MIGREKIGGRYYNYFNVRGEDGLLRNVDLERVKYRKIDDVEVCLMVIVPREHHGTEEVQKAKLEELQKLASFESYVIIENVGQYRISSTWVIYYKGKDIRARLVARGFEEDEDIASDSPTIEKCNLRLVLVFAASYGWIIESSDVKSAFLQGRKLERDVIVQPPKEAKLPKGKLWKLQVPLYGLNDASLQFFLKCRDILLELGCFQCLVDPALFFKRNTRNELIGVMALHVDDFLHCGTEEFVREVPRKLAAIFKMGRTEQKVFKYVGYNITQADDYSIKVDQDDFAKEKIELINVDPARAKQVKEPLTKEEESLMRKAAGRIGWLGRGTRPDIVFEQIAMSTKFGKGHVKDLNQAAKVMRKVHASPSFFKISPLGPVEGWNLEMFTDASHGNLNDGVDGTGSQVLMVRTNAGLCAPLSWQANKLKRICDSSLEAEVLALVEGLKEEVYMRELIEEVCGLKEKSIPLRGIVDNRGTKDAIYATTVVGNKRYKRDFAAIKQMMSRKEVSGIDWVPGARQLADCMSKREAPSWELLQVFQTGRRTIVREKEG